MQSVYRIITSVVLVCVVCGVSARVSAQQPAPEEAKEEQGGNDLGRSSEVVEALAKGKVTIPKPDGWIVARPPKGSIALFRDAGEKTSQLEVKYSPEVTKEQHDRYCQTFHTTLMKMGFEEQKTPWASAVEGFEFGKIVEYKLMSQGKPYRVLVWQAHRADATWMIVGFFPEGARDVYFKQIEALAKSMKFS